MARIYCRLFVSKPVNLWWFITNQKKENYLQLEVWPFLIGIFFLQNLLILTLTSGTILKLQHSRPIGDASPKKSNVSQSNGGSSMRKSKTSKTTK